MKEYVERMYMPAASAEASNGHYLIEKENF
jgi:hypothetical protein